MEPASSSRPYMPGYGVEPDDDGERLLPWSWAEERLRTSHDYWVATVVPTGGPHVMPVWGVWSYAGLWFSSGMRSRKARNILADARCVATTDRARQPVVLEGRVRIVTESDRLTWFIDATNSKYHTSYDVEFLDPDVNGTFLLRPTKVIGLDDDDFTGSPTRWVFDEKDDDTL